MKRVIRLFVFFFIPFSVNAVDINKSDWIKNMSAALPAVFCNSRQYFRQCFNISAQECKNTTASVTQVCISKNISHIPHILVQPEDGTYWGTIIGKCVAEAYQVTLAKKRIDNTKCNDQKNW